MSLFAWGTPNDWVGRSTDVAGPGVVLLVLLAAGGVFFLTSRRSMVGTSIMASLAAGLSTLFTVELIDLRPAAWRVLLVTGFVVLTARSLRRDRGRAR